MTANELSAVYINLIEKIAEDFESCKCKRDHYHTYTASVEFAYRYWQDIYTKTFEKDILTAHFVISFISGYYVDQNGKVVNSHPIIIDELAKYVVIEKYEHGQKIFMLADPDLIIGVREFMSTILHGLGQIAFLNKSRHKYPIPAKGMFK